MMEGFFSRKKFVFLNIIDEEDEFENNQKYWLLVFEKIQRLIYWKTFVVCIKQKLKECAFAYLDYEMYILYCIVCTFFTICMLVC